MSKLAFELAYKRAKKEKAIGRDLEVGKGPKIARLRSKTIWVTKIRVLRKFLKELKRQKFT